MLNWEEYVKKGLVRKTAINKGLVKSLINMADNGIQVISKLNLDENNCSVIFTNYYDSLRGICEALSLLKNYKIYSHEAIGLFLKRILLEEAIFQKFDKFRIMRNNIKYYGKMIPFEEAKQGVIDIKEIVDKLKSKYLEEFCKNGP